MAKDMKKVTLDNFGSRKRKMYFVKERTHSDDIVVLKI